MGEQEAPKEGTDATKGAAGKGLLDIVRLPGFTPLSTTEVVDLARRFFGHGRSLFFLSVGLVLVTTISARETFLHIQQNLDRLKKTTTNLIETEFEPRRSDTAFGVLGIVLGGINHKDQSRDRCTAKPSDIDLLERVTKRTQGFFDEIDNTSSESNHDVLRALYHVGDDRRQMSDHQWPIQHGIERYVPCPITPSAPGYQASTDAMWCDARDDATPRRETVALITPELRGPGVFGTPRLDAERVAEATSTMLFHEAVIPELPNLTEADLDVVTLYFVGPHDVIRQWRRYDPKTPAGDDFGEFHRWGAVSYVEQFIVHPDCNTYRSRAYIDYDGGGLVRTTCRRITNPAHDPTFAGVVCIDRQVPPEEIIESLNEDNLVKYQKVTYPRSDRHAKPSDAPCTGFVMEGLSPREPRPEVVPVTLTCQVSADSSQTVRGVTNIDLHDPDVPGEKVPKGARLLPLGVTRPLDGPKPLDGAKGT